MAGFNRYDNTVTYKSPAFSGFNVYAQYSFGTEPVTNGTEGKSSVDRYYGIGATYKNGPLNAVLIVDSTNYSTLKYTGDVDDSINVTLGGSYDFGMVKPYVGFQYFDNTLLTQVDSLAAEDFFGLEDNDRLFGSGYGFTLGADVPAFGGTAKIAAGYLKADVDNQYTAAVEGGAAAAYGDAAGNGEFDSWGVSVGYNYFFSKRTDVYTVVSYMDETYKADGMDEVNPSYVEFGVGLRHRF